MDQQHRAAEPDDQEQQDAVVIAGYGRRFGIAGRRFVPTRGRHVGRGRLGLRSITPLAVLPV